MVFLLAGFPASRFKASPKKYGEPAKKFEALPAADAPHSAA